MGYKSWNTRRTTCSFSEFCESLNISQTNEFVNHRCLISTSYKHYNSEYVMKSRISKESLMPQMTCWQQLVRTWFAFLAPTKSCEKLALSTRKIAPGQGYQHGKEGPCNRGTKRKNCLYREPYVRSNLARKHRILLKSMSAYCEKEYYLQSLQMQFNSKLYLLAEHPWCFLVTLVGT